MLELNENIKREDFNSRVALFQKDMMALLDNYKLELIPIIQYNPYGIIPQLSINDKKYATLSSNTPSEIIQPEQFTKDEKGLAVNKEIMERATKTKKK